MPAVAPKCSVAGRGALVSGSASAGDAGGAGAAFTIYGYGSATTGGTGGTEYVVTTYAEFKTRVEQAGTRIIKFPATIGTLDGLGAVCKLNDPNCTIDATGSDVQFKRVDFRLQTSHVILKGLRLRPGDEVNLPDDCDGLSIFGESSGVIGNIVIDHCSISWGPDVQLAILNEATDITIQHCLIGPGLFHSAHSEANALNKDHCDGPNFATVASQGANPSQWTKRITFYRNFVLHCDQRSLRCQGTDAIDYVNNVVYDWGHFLAYGNPRGANFIGNMFKKGPETVFGNSNRVWLIDTNSSWTTSFTDAVWWDDNIPLGAWTPTFTYGTGQQRSAVYGTPSVTATAASQSLADAVVAAAGPLVTDATDQVFKDDYTNGTGSFWNGAGWAAPNPSWP